MQGKLFFYKKIEINLPMSKISCTFALEILGKLQTML